MSGLRLFEDTMNTLIERDRRLLQISQNAAAYTDKCEAIRQDHLPRGECIPSAFHKANEGLCAARIIMGRHGG